MIRNTRKRDWFWGERAATAKLADAKERSVYLALLEIDRGAGLVFASQQTIADTAKVSLSSVQRVLPGLEAKGLIERANSETVAGLIDELGRIPAAVVYILTNAEQSNRGEPRRTERIEPARLVTTVRDAVSGQEYGAARKRTLAIVQRFLAQERVEHAYGWLIRMYDQAFSVLGSVAAGEILAYAAVATARANPAGKPMAYMNRIVLDTVKKRHLSGEAKAADLSQESTKAFGWGEE
jgi:hypothetical protein